MNDIKVLNIVDGYVQGNGDLRIPIDSLGKFAGEPVFISGTDKITQDVTKGLLTIIGTNYLVPNYGTTLRKSLHSRKLDDMSKQISREIQTLLGYLAQYNIHQPNSEQLIELVDLTATEGIDSITVAMTVRTGNGTTVALTL